MYFIFLIAVRILLWLVALGWVLRVLAAHRGLPGIPDLLLPEHDLVPSGAPTLTVIVPARNEEENVGSCLESLLSQDYAEVRILAVNDRSTDATGAVMDAFEKLHPEKLEVMHVRELPGGWLGKTHAMATAARVAGSDFLLFTDADVIFQPASLRKALANAIATRADHLVLIPTTIRRGWDEAALLGFFQIFGFWGVRPWKVGDVKAKRDAIGIGAFNLIRRTAYERIGGFESFPMEVVEDLGLGRRVKWAGLRQRVAFGQGLVRVHWATGALGLVNVMTKNMFSIFNFHVWLVLLACGWLGVFAILPFVCVLAPGLMLPAWVAIAAIAYGYVLMSRPSGISAWNVVLTPFAAAVFVYALLRSMRTTLRQGGVVWRGTFYSLAELRRHTVPLMRQS